MRVIDNIIKNESLLDLGKEYGEIIIDSNLETKILKEIPVLSTITSLYSFGNSIHKMIFIKKIYRFLFQIRDISTENRIQFIDKINNSEKYENSVGETLIEIINKIDSEKKPKIIGNLFKAFLEEKITYEEFIDYTHLVNLANVNELIELRNGLNGRKVVNGSDFLMIMGLFRTDYVKHFNSVENSNDENFTEITDYGRRLLEFGLIDI